MEGHQHGAQPQPKKPAPKVVPVAELAGKTFSLTTLERKETLANLAAFDFKREQLNEEERKYRLMVARRALARNGVAVEQELEFAIASSPDGSMVSFTVKAPALTAESTTWTPAAAST